jgi:hypothetical protein
MTKEKLGNRRVTGKEQFYTADDVAATVLDRVIASTGASPKSSFLEPAGGTGAFIKAAERAGFSDIWSVDIEPQHKRVLEGDFLRSDFDLRSAVCVSNPPFGRNNSLSVPFFNKAAQYSDVIAFIVPRSWRKWTVLNRLDPTFELVDDWDLSVDYVDVMGEYTHGVGNLRTCVQVWKKLPEGRQRLKVEVKDNGFLKKGPYSEADASFTLFGYGCGTTKTSFERKPNTTQAFFQLLRPDSLEALQAVDFSRFYNHTAFTEALSISEINYGLNEWAGMKDFEYSLVPSEPNYLGLQYVEQGLF